MTKLSDAHAETIELKGKRAIITGGTTGIGRAIAVLLASYGVKGFICGRAAERLEAALQRIHEVGESAGRTADMVQSDQIASFFERADKYLGGLDIAVINAGIPVDSVAETSEDELRYAIETDLTAYVVASQKAATRMKQGDIVLIG